MYHQWVLTALLAWPALAALVVMVAPARWAKHVALAASLVEFAISAPLWWTFAPAGGFQFILDRKSTRLNSSHLVISYAVFCLKKKKNNIYPLSQHCSIYDVHQQ